MQGPISGVGGCRNRTRGIIKVCLGHIIAPRHTGGWCSRSASATSLNKGPASIVPKPLKPHLIEHFLQQRTQ